MSMRYPGGIISATAPTVNTTSAKGVWTLEQVAQYVKAGTWPSPPSLTDPYFEYVTTLLPGTGTNGAQNNTFLDSSSSPFSITRNGNSTQGTFSPFSQTGWGNYFDGNGDYIVSATNTGLNISSGDFTVEFWVYATTLTGGMEPLQFGDGTNGYSALFGYLSGSNPSTLQLYLSSAGSSWDVSSGQSMGTITANEWIHYAVTRSGNTFRTFKNGTLVSSFVSSSSIYISTNQVSIGNGQGTHYWFGYVSNARVVKGTALYTASFTPSTTPLTAVSGTSLLTCQSNRFIDNSTNALAITVYGNTAVQAFSPFNPTAAWSSATNGGSGYFDGSGDYLTFTEQALSGNFTLEGWFYPTHTSGTKSQCLFGGTSTNTQNNIDEYNYGGIGYYNNGARFDLSGTNFYHYCWNHFAYVRSGSTVKLWINGADSGGSCTDNGTFYLSAVLGNTTYGLSYLGYSNIRVSNSARYTTAFTPPTAPWTSDANTVLLINGTNAGIYDAASKSNFETIGDAQISTSQSKWGGGSIFFDGTSDGLPNTNTNILQLDASNFTVEFWCYPLDTTDRVLICIGTGWNSANSLCMLQYLNNYSISCGTVYANGFGAVTSNAWRHFAIVRSGSTVTLYINGTSAGTISSSENLNIGTLKLGVALSPWPGVNGYINDLRITKGIARYTTNFTPPAAAFELF